MKRKHSGSKTGKDQCMNGCKRCYFDNFCKKGIFDLGDESHKSLYGAKRVYT
jgi:hypothetical protein